MIEVEAPDGAIIEFPDGTPPEVMSTAMKKYLGRGAAPKAAATEPEPSPAGQLEERTALEAVNRLVGGATDSAAQGASFGFIDEINAGMRSGARGIGNLLQGQTPEFSANYDRALADERSRMKQFDAENPVLSTTTNVLGGLASGVPAVGAVKGAGAVGGIARSAGIGAGYGALGGFGAGEGGFENRLESAATGAVAGGALGAALPAVGAVANRAAGMASNVMGTRNPRNVALDALNRGLERDQVSPAEIAARLAASEKPLSIMDVAGDNARRQARLAESTPGPGSNAMKEFLHDRQYGQVDRVAGDIQQHLSGDDFYKSLDELNNVRRDAAAPLYETAYQQRFVWNDRVEDLLKRPSTKQALGRAYRIAAEEGRDPRGLGLNLDEEGNVAIDKTLASMQTLDYVKRGLDDVLEAFRDGTTGKLRLDESGRAINATRATFIDTIDKMNPTYAKARAAWGGPTQTMEAMRLGRQFAKADAEVTIERFKKLPDGDQDAFRIGVARELAGAVQNTRDGSNSVARIFGSQGQRNRLRQLFPSDDEFKAFEKAMKEEQVMSVSRNEVLGNSKTARNLADQQDAGALGQVAIDFSGGGLAGAAMGFARRAINRAGSGMAEKPAAELANLLATSDRRTQGKVLRELARRRVAVESRANAATGAIVGGSSAAANLMGQAAAQNQQR